jgi:hypothetical protein
MIKEITQSIRNNTNRNLQLLNLRLELGFITRAFFTKPLKGFSRKFNKEDPINMKTNSSTIS